MGTLFVGFTISTISIGHIWSKLPNPSPLRQAEKWRYLNLLIFTPDFSYVLLYILAHRRPSIKIRICGGLWDQDLSNAYQNAA